MSATLPAELEPYIIAGSPAESLHAATAAAARGEFGYEIVAKLAAVIARGDEPRFAKTKPIPLYVLEYIRQRQDSMPPMQAIYVGYSEGLWSLEVAEAFCENQIALSEAKKQPAPRGVYLTRNRRKKRILPRTDGMFVPKMSLDALLDGFVRDGAKTCLALLLSKAGKAKSLITYTCSIAMQLGRTTRTIRNYFIELEQAGLIRRRPGKSPNTVEITFADACRPEPYKEPLDVKAFKLARRTTNPVLRQLADTLTVMSWKAHEAELRLEEGRKEISAFNPDSILNRRVDAPKVVRNGVTTHSALTTSRPKAFFRRLSAPVERYQAQERASSDNFSSRRDISPIDSSRPSLREATRSAELSATPRNALTAGPPELLAFRS